MHEKIPQLVPLSYETIHVLNHGLIAFTAYNALHVGQGPKFVIRAYDESLQQNHEMLKRRFELLGHMLEPVLENHEYVDDELLRQRIFITGCALAAIIADSYATELGSDADEWKTAWAQASTYFDVALAPRPADRDAVQWRTERAATMIDQGLHYLGVLEAPYIAILEEVLDEYPEVAREPNIFKVAFGYAFLRARNIIDTLASRRAEEVAQQN